jgi:hypothetical protein
VNNNTTFINFDEIYENAGSDMTVCLRTVRILTETDITGLYPSLAASYKKHQDSVGDHQNLKMLITLLNSAYTQKRGVFIITRSLFRALAKRDKNWGPKGLRYSNSLWTSFISFITRTGMIKIVNPEDVGTRRPLIYQIAHTPTLNLFNLSDMEILTQKNQCLFFTANAADLDLGFRSGTEKVVVSSYSSSTNSHSNEENNKKEEVKRINTSGENRFHNNWDIELDNPPAIIPKDTGADLSGQRVNITEPANSPKYWKVFEKHIPLADWDLLRPGDRALIRHSVREFGNEIRIRSKKSIQAKIEIFTNGPLTTLGSPCVPKEAIQSLIDQRFVKKDGTVDVRAESVYDQFTACLEASYDIGLQKYFRYLKARES